MKSGGGGVRRAHTAAVAEVRSVMAAERWWDLSDDAVCVLDGRMRVAALSPGGERALGWRAAQVVGTPVRDWLHPCDVEALRDSLPVAQELDRFDGWTTRVRHADGSWRALSWSGVREDGSWYCCGRPAEPADGGDGAMLARVREALDEDRFVLYAQPIVDVEHGRPVQQELLVRMVERDGSEVPPGEFLPVSERCGLVAEIDRWVIRRAVQLVAATGRAVQVNVSAASLGEPSVLAALEEALAHEGVDPSLLVFEVTETAMVDRMDAGRAFARRLAQLGCGLALDDFGTGFASLSYLKHLEVDVLKIDIEFVRELVSSEADAHLVRFIVRLAEDFGLVTIAEGVEDEPTLRRLRELGVQLAQGFLFGRPRRVTGHAAGASSRS